MKVLSLRWQGPKMVVVRNNEKEGLHKAVIKKSMKYLDINKAATAESMPCALFTPSTSEPNGKRTT